MASENEQGGTRRGLGLALSVPESVILTIARAAEAARYASFWVNNPPGGDALAVLGAVSGETGAMHLGVGVIPLSHQSPVEITAAVRDHGVPRDRLYLGIGSGSGAGGLERVAEGIRVLQPELAGSIVVAALGPRMSRLAAETADGVLLNWLTPAYARQSAERIRRSASAAGRPTPRLMAYVRVALGAGAVARLDEEASRYAAIPHYAAHFDRMGVSAVETAVSGGTAEDIQRGLALWDGAVDEVIVRAITADDREQSIMGLLEAAAI